MSKINKYINSLPRYSRTLKTSKWWIEKELKGIDIEKEYFLIKDKKSILSANKRKLVVTVYEAANEI